MTSKEVMAREKRNLRRWVRREFRRLGLDCDEVAPSNGHRTKDEIRTLHQRQRVALLRRERLFVSKWQEQLINNFANGSEVDPSEISPRVVEIRTDEQAALFRYATLHWSVPVSRGYGRRTRFLVLDRQNGKLIGVFALGDPVYNLTVRDELIGWTTEQRNDRLYNVLDAYVLGAVPPYRELLGGKLIAMAAVSDTTREMIRRKYQGRRTEILNEVKQARPVLITTTSALGRSSIYNRLKFGDQLLYRPVGYTRGFGHFQFSDPLFRAMLDYLGRGGGAPGYNFGEGPNWRIRTVRVALRKLDLSTSLVHHGIHRQVFLAPLARKWEAFLRGELQRPAWYRFPLQDMAEFFRIRWAIPRSQRDSSFAEVQREGMAILTKHQLQTAGKR